MTHMQIQKQKIKKAFSRAANDYDNHANLQNHSCHRLLQCTQIQVKSADIIVEMGCGTGYAIDSLTNYYQKSNIIALDFSLLMLNQVKSRKMVYQLCADFDNLPLAPQSVDLIFSNLSVQWSFNFEKTLIAWKNIIKPQGYVCLSSLASDTLQELHQARETLGLVSNAARFINVEQIAKIVSRYFIVHTLTTETITLAFPDLWSVVKSIKGVGAQAIMQDSSKQKWQGLIGKHYWQALDAHYPRCQQTGIYPLSYEVAYAVLQVD